MDIVTIVKLHFLGVLITYFVLCVIDVKDRGEVKAKYAIDHGGNFSISIIWELLVFVNLIDKIATYIGERL